MRSEVNSRVQNIPNLDTLFYKGRIYYNCINKKISEINMRWRQIKNYSFLMIKENIIRNKSFFNVISTIGELIIETW